MDKKESLKILDKYTHALKAKAEAEEGLGKVDSAFRINPSDYIVPFGKILAPFIGSFLVIALAFRIAVGSSLKYNNEVPVTVGLFAGAAVIGLGVAKIVHAIMQNKARKNLKSAQEISNQTKQNKTAEYKSVISKMSYKIAEAESVLPVSCRGIEAARNAKNKLLSGKAETLEQVTGGYTEADWEEAYTAAPKMFSMPDGRVFGGLAITEATRTVLPKDPKSKFASEGDDISDWRLVAVSITRNDALGDCDYYNAFAKLEPYIIDSKEDSILIRGLTVKELERLLED